MTPETNFFLENNYAKGLIKEPVNLGVQALLSCCEYYNDRMKSGTANGEKWVYTNKSEHSPQHGYFDDMINNTSLRGCNCASPTQWVFTDMGIIPNTCRFYGGSSGEFKSHGNPSTDEVYKLVSEACTITDIHDSPVPFHKMFSDGMIKAGDVILAVHHTFIYRGDRTFYAAGHDGKWHSDPEAITEDLRKCVFEDWVCEMESCSNNNYDVHYIVRMRDDYIPKFYRDTEGKLRENIMA